MSNRWIYGTTVARAVGLTSARFALPAGGGNQLVVAVPASNDPCFVEFGDSTLVTSIGATDATQVDPGDKVPLEIPTGATHYAIISTAVGYLYFRGREGVSGPIGSTNFFDIVPLQLGRGANVEGSIGGTTPSGGRWFAFSGTGPVTISGCWDMEDPRMNLTHGQSYTMRCTLIARTIATGAIYQGTDLQFIMRQGSHIDLWEATGTITGISNNTTSLGTVPVSATILYNETNHFLGAVVVNVPTGVRIEITDMVLVPYVPLPNPWDDIPDITARTFSVNDNLMPGAVQGLATPILIAPGLTNLNIKLTYNGLLDGQITSSAWVYVTGLTYVGFSAADLTIPFRKFWWRPGDEADLWITIPIVNPSSTTGHQFTLAFKVQGLNGVNPSATFRVDPAGVNQSLPGTMPAHRDPLFLDLSAATPDVEADLVDMEWSDNGFENNGTAATDPPCWRSRLYHGYTQAGGNVGLYTNEDAWPGVHMNPFSKEVDSNARPFLRLHAAKFPAPVPYFGVDYYFQSAQITTQKMDVWNHQTGVYRLWATMPNQKGCWTAFWCIGQRTNTDPRQSIWPPEIDFFENFNGYYSGWIHDQYETSSTQHCGVHGSGQRKEINGIGLELDRMGFSTDFSFWTQIHEIACVITDATYTHFVDGIETFQHRNMNRSADGNPNWAFYPLLQMQTSTDPTDPFIDGTTDMLVYKMDYFPPGADFTIEPFTDDPPWANTPALTPNPDLDWWIGASMTGVGTMTVAFSGAIFSDNFNRANETLQASGNWTRIGFQSDKLRVTDNAVENTSLSIGPLYASPDFGVANHYAQVVWKNVGAIATGLLCVRAIDTNNFIGVRVLNGLADLRKRVAGVVTIISGTSTAAAVNDLFRIEASGTTITFKKNGATIATVTITELATATKTGLYGEGGGANPWVDDYESGPL